MGWRHTRARQKYVGMRGQHAAAATRAPTLTHAGVACTRGQSRQATTEEERHVHMRRMRPSTLTAGGCGMTAATHAPRARSACGARMAVRNAGGCARARSHTYAAAHTRACRGLRASALCICCTTGSQMQAPSIKRWLAAHAGTTPQHARPRHAVWQAAGATHKHTRGRGRRQQGGARKPRLHTRRTHTPSSL